MAKFICKNIVLEVSTEEAGTTFGEIGQVMSIDPPQGSTAEVEVTTLDNEDSIQEFLQGFRDGGECTLEIVFDPAQHFTPANSIWKLFKSGATRVYRIGLGTGVGHRYKFGGYVRDAGLGQLAPNQALMLNATVRVSAISDFEAIT